MRLRFSRRTDYAVRAALELALHPDTLVTREQIARTTHAPSTVVAQALADLVRAGIAEATLGRLGGYRLARPAEQTTILAVVDAVEPHRPVPRCVLRDQVCSHTGACPFHETLLQAQDAYRERLAAETLADVAARTLTINGSLPQ